MFTTVDSVKEYTNKDVSLDLIKRAQAIIEIYIGRDEIEVENPSDLMVLNKMTAYQAVYMLENEDVIYKQVAVTSAGSGESSQNFDTTFNAPFIAPLAVIASRALSFNRSRSIRTGKIFQWNRRVDWRTI
jgi:hypothetical protein